MIVLLFSFSVLHCTYSSGITDLLPSISSSLFFFFFWLTGAFESFAVNWGFSGLV